MKSVPLGNTRVEVSPICLGTLYFGSRVPRETSYELLDMYNEMGGSFLDTANTYSFWLPGFKGGESESLLGNWMKERGNRSQLFIATKVGLGYPGVDQGLRANQIKKECEKSLIRLKTEAIDLYYAHFDDRSTPTEEIMQAFDDLVRAGKVRFIGASNFMTWRIEEAHWISQTRGLVEYCCIQQRYSYVRPHPGGRFDPQVVVDSQLLDYCLNRGIALVAYSPLLGGAYTRADRSFPEQYTGSDTEGRMSVLRSVAEETNATVNQVVLAWMMQNNPVVIPCIGVSTAEQIEENLGASAIKFAAEQLSRLNTACTGGTAW